MNNRDKFKWGAVILLITVVQAIAQTPIQSDFTYQGELTFNSQVTNGLYDFEINAFDALNNGNQNGSTINMDAVEVDNGIFTLNLDFGDAVFVGTEVFLEIHVRENNSGSPFNALSPRQKLTNTPYAIHAQFVGADAITSDEISDGSILNQDIHNNSISSEKIANNAVGTSEIKSDEVQRRISASCSQGDFIQAVNESGSVVCNSMSTDVTSADIVDGTIETVDIANDAISKIKLADNAVGEIEVISSEVQLRVNSICQEGSYLRGINENGTVLCQELAINIKKRIAFSNSASYINAVVMPSTGYLLISFYDNLTFDLKMYECQDKLCSIGVLRTLDTDGVVGLYNRMVQLPQTGNPMISYYDMTNANLKIYTCFSNNCSSGNSSILDDSDDVGKFSSITIGLDGNPIISYIDSLNNGLKVRACFNSTCAAGNEWTLDSNNVSGYSRIVIRPDTGLPLISYYGDDRLKLFSCTNTFCSMGNIRLLDNSSSNVGFYSDMVLAMDDIPKISYYDSTNGDLKLYVCDNKDCTSGEIRLLDENGDVGLNSRIIYDPQRRASTISYFDNTKKDLKLFTCNNTSCSIGDTIIVDSRGSVGIYSTLILNQTNKLQIVYKSETNGVAIMNCYDNYCLD